jgi:PilZ domain
VIAMPETSALAAATDPSERRRFVRIACPPDASARLRAGTSARLLDLGLGGALVESTTRLTPGTVNATMFVSPDVAFRARAHIVRAFVVGVTRDEDGGTSLLYRAGLEFGPMSAVEAGTLGTFVTTALRTAAPCTPAEHPQRTISIRFPHGWAVSRKQGAVVARAPDGPRFIILGAPQSRSDLDLGETARRSMQNAGFSSLHGQASTINNRPAWVGFYTGRLQDLGVVVVEAAHIVLGDHVYLVAGVTPFASYETARHDFFAAISSFGSESGVDDVQLVPAPSSCAVDLFDLAAAPALSVA